MSIDDFVRYSEMLHRLTADFVGAVPENKWDFTSDPPAKSGRAPAPHRIGDGFSPFCNQLRHVMGLVKIDAIDPATRSPTSAQ